MQLMRLNRNTGFQPVSWRCGRSAVRSETRRRPQVDGYRSVDLMGLRDSFYTAMLEVTENAVRHLRSLLQSQDAGDKGLRVQIAKGGCSGLQYEMLLDGKKDGDAVVERDGMEFFVDPESAPILKGSTLDYHDGLTGTGFRIVNPNATRTCGCGTSFEAAPSA